jgi:hypothetical protein
MQQTTDLSAVKEMAVNFLYQDITPTEFSPAVVIHPVFESGIQCPKQTGQIANIMEDEKALTMMQKEVTELIEAQETVLNVYEIIRSPYHLTFFKYIKDYLSKEDYARLLADAWVYSENPNQDVNVSVRTAAGYFKKADKRLLMSEEDYKIYQSLPEEFPVYRGVGVGRNPDGLSWTAHKEKALWFAGRFDTEKEHGYLQKATVRKVQVLAYFNIRNEDELVIPVPPEQIEKESLF